MPAAEVDVGPDLVRALLDDQCPELRDLPLNLAASGWDNVMFRLGDDLAVRLPRRAVAAELIEHEQRWLPQLAPRLPLPIPAPVHAGRPAGGFPWCWSVTPWLPGTIAEHAPPPDVETTAEVLGSFLAALHQPSPVDAPRNPFRGVPLADRAPVVEERIEQLHDLLDAPRVRAAWDDLAGAPAWAQPPVWLHGDLHPANILVHEHRVSAVVDFGDITGGDPATDLAVAWMLLPARVRTRFRHAAGVGADDDTWVRARAWALALAVAYIAGSADHPVVAGIGRRTLAAALADG